MDVTGCKSRPVSLWIGLAVLVCASGCQSGGGQASFANPFLSRDRVPPPATRSLVPGSAAPYYPGDPVPVLQGAAPLQQQPVVATPSTPPPPITPITAAPVPSQTYVGGTGYVPTPLAMPTPPTSATPTASPPTATGPPAPMMAMNTASSGVQPAVYNQPLHANHSASPAGFAVSGQQNDLVDTGFTQPALPAAADPGVELESPPLTADDARSAADEQVPWRRPSGSTPSTVADNYQPVQLQPVSSSSPQGPVEPQSAPRIRLPGAMSGVRSQPPPAVSMAAPAHGPQTLAITELPPHGAAMLAAPQLAPPAPTGPPWQTSPSAPANYGGVANDGFRPRTSLR